MPRLALTLLVLSLLSPFVAGEAAEPFAPMSVMVQSDGATAAHVEWVPGPQRADSYRVYGLDRDSETLLVDTADLGVPLVVAVAVPAGFSTYAVSGVQNGEESRLILPPDLPSILECRPGIVLYPPEVGMDGCRLPPRVKVHLS